MAVDTETKRRSALAMNIMSLVVAPLPDGTIAAVDREHIVGIYAGIAPAVSGALSWSAGLLTYKGVTYEISAGSTTKKFVYWDPNYTTVFRTTDVLQDVFDADGWIMCLNESGVAYPAFARKLIHGGIIRAGTITAEYAQIADAAIGTAKIIDLAVDTIKIANQAVSVPVGAYTAGSIALTSTPTTVQQVSITTSGAFVGIWFGAQIFLTGGGAEKYTMTVVRDSTIIFTSIEVGAVEMPYSLMINESPGAGSYTYYLKVAMDVGTGSARSRSLIVQEMKK